MSFTVDPDAIRAFAQQMTEHVAVTQAARGYLHRHKDLARQSDIGLLSHPAAHSVAVEIGARHQEARAHAGRARAHRACGDLAGARAEYERAYALHTRLELPSADQIREELATILPP
ncbi:hypothetical protein Ais01nite_02700 [Asanoa ishikariensis]|uniref:Uncharacterized protein n=1 Tax=Asanoa ishikariensis TaxID=137265 RepID=A0A1H3TM97_9ACTN|nr:hypothetical protein [Asanoa ishikariensis]GIF62235.1 hypothetical protein Ais01nite_02700 [Asanoa ishikariensis]SDZ50775.1 hypothetical protein SAMN05421684_5962 [Asanoa ishikariensis]